MVRLRQLCLLLSSLAISGVYSQNTVTTYAFNDTGPLSTFKSRPDIQAPFLNITLYNEKYVEPGYIFLAPYQTNQDSVYMYDSRGNLVWTGFGPTGGGVHHNLQVCQINGTDHLCYFNGNQFQGYGRGHGIILDQTLSVASSIQAQGGLGANDEHEFNVVDDGKAALITSYVTSQYDLTAFNITNGQGWVIDNYFQKVEIGTNELLFEWRALDHVPIADTYIKPNSTDVSGTGLDPFSPFDWFHINAVDQNSDGDYLVSSRHLSTIFKVDGKDGSIIWQLGGVSSDFSFEPGLNFSFQHDARFRYENSTTTILSIFNNANNGFNQSSRYSSGMVLKIDHTTKLTTLLRQYVPPLDLVSDSQGNIQVLGSNSVWDSANIFSGWGSNAYVAEFTNDGTLVLNGHFATTGSMNYRAYKANFTTSPTDAPASYTYAHNTSAPTVFYMSWNGATQAAQWRIYVSDSRSGTYTRLTTVKREGFETIYTSPGYHAWSLIEALDASGNGIRNSTRPRNTFVPSSSLATSCTESECPVALGYNNAHGSGTSSGGRGMTTATSTNPGEKRAAVGVAWAFLAMILVGVGMI